MQTGDGLLARLRVSDDRLTPAQLSEIARLAALYGNGQVEITARGNLQVRGLTAASTPAFANAVRAVVDIDSGLVVETPPLLLNLVASQTFTVDGRDYDLGAKVENILGEEYERSQTFANGGSGVVEGYKLGRTVSFSVSTSF